MKVSYCVLFAAVVLVPCAAPADAATSVITREQIEADWLRQDAVRGLAAKMGNVSPAEDAAGGCDGVKNGKWGFHTGFDQQPWWQVDLGAVAPLDELVIYNRSDDLGAAQRAIGLVVQLSDDGRAWREVYRHKGPVFRGTPDGKPLAAPLGGAKARYLRIQLSQPGFLHLDEVEVYSAVGGKRQNVALGKSATQSSTSQWSARSLARVPDAVKFHTDEVVQRGLKLAANLRTLGVNVDEQVGALNEVAESLKGMPADAPADARRAAYFKARWAVRAMTMANPLLDFDQLVFVKRVPTSFTHMSDQYYGWFSRPGGGLYVLENFKSDSPTIRCLTPDMPEGNIIRPELSYDGTKVLFAHAKFHPGLAENPNKLDKSKIPEDAFYHLYEINVDGSGLRRLTRGKYDDFDGRYLPSGDIVFLSTRRGQFVQCSKSTAASTSTGELPDSYVRCGGGPERPVAVYTLHVMDGEGGNLRAISPFENFEWTPSVADDGRILFARWDYVDRDNMPYISLWSTTPDGTDLAAVFGNFTKLPHCIFEARSVPNSRKLIFTASGHHSVTGGSLVLLDTNRGADGADPMTRLTPEVPFPEVEAWPNSYYANPVPLSEEHYLVSWSDQPMAPGWPNLHPANAMGLYLYDAFGNLNLVYRDPAISSMNPVPIRPRVRPPAVSSRVAWDGSQESKMLVLDVYQGLDGVERGAIRALRIVGVPAKTQPTMNSPSLGITADDPGKFVLGTAPVEDDGSAFFRVPSGVPIFLQALDADGKAVQTMRTATHVQPGQTFTCVGCHERRNTSPPNLHAKAALRAPSRLAAGPEGSWPLDFDVLVQPVLDRRCVECHKSGGTAGKSDLTAGRAYETLIASGNPSLRNYVQMYYREGRSTPGRGVAANSSLLALLNKGHYETKLDAAERDRLITWMDTYAQRLGSFSPDQERRLRQLRAELSAMVVEPK
ncbi:MAG: HzsA-related protein [Pirellulales bacterium]